MMDWHANEQLALMAVVDMENATTSGSLLPSLEETIPMHGIQRNRLPADSASLIFIYAEFIYVVRMLVSEWL
jgi:hypothetical protein